MFLAFFLRISQLLMHLIGYFIPKSHRKQYLKNAMKMIDRNDRQGVPCFLK